MSPQTQRSEVLTFRRIHYHEVGCLSNYSRCFRLFQAYPFRIRLLSPRCLSFLCGSYIRQHKRMYPDKASDQAALYKNQQYLRLWLFHQEYCCHIPEQSRPFCIPLLLSVCQAYERHKHWGCRCFEKHNLLQYWQQQL